MDEEIVEEGRLFATFERHGEFTDAQAALLALDLTKNPTPEQERTETALHRRLSDILDEYQEQAHLLDPFLEQLVTPVVECIKRHAAALAQNSANAEDPTNPARIARVASLLYCYVKSRGYKTIIRFFPHEIADLALARACLGGVAREPRQWALRYAALLWLALICMIPFDLAQFDEHADGETADALEGLARSFLNRAGLERGGAALLLARLYTRKDTRVRFTAFLDWVDECVSTATDALTLIGALQVLCEVAKDGPADLIQGNATRFFAIGNAIEATEVLNNNTIVRKFKTKLVARIPLRILPPTSNATRRKGRALTGEDRGGPELLLEDDIEVPEEVEVVLELLFKSLQDKDTIVRWSAAKAVARISERLPTEFADQVLETLMGLFAIHSIAAASLYDLPAIAESTWHGACLACAEMARRGLVARSALPELMEWLSKALYFDLRKGAHSIGSSVRDSAAYVLWALARAQDPTALAPHADNLARRLVTVALYDREIHIRRAASAAFQEHVGRTSLFPHGIDVLRKTDFYAVSVRRNAFLVAAPQVAEHLEYRGFLFDHLLNVTARHWDLSMRRLGSQSLRLICSPHLPTLGPLVITRAAKLLESVDNSDLHGSLLALTEIAIAYRESSVVPEERERRLRQAFGCLALIPESVLLGPRSELITAAACGLLAQTITLPEINLQSNSAVQIWRKLLDFGLKHRSIPVQEEAAAAMGAVSRLVDCSAVVNRLIHELKTGSVAMQQALGRMLGVVDYDTYPACLPDALRCLLDCIGPTPTVKLCIEARRNCYAAIPQIVFTVVPHLPQHLSAETFNSLVNAMLHGLQDYTIDERGDVGSWIRIACLRGLSAFCTISLPNAITVSKFEEYFPSATYHAIVGGILKQGVERLDNVRQEAGECFRTLIRPAPPKIRSGHAWAPKNLPLLRELFLSETEMMGWKDGAWLFPKAVRLLEIPEYRQPVLAGLVLSLGSKTESTQRPVGRSLVEYSRSLPLASDAKEGYSLVGLVRDLLKYARTNLSSNGIVVPVLQTFNVLLEADALRRLDGDPEAETGLQDLLSIVTKNVSRLKSVQRIHESMKIVVNMLAFSTLFERCVASLPHFLAHEYPSIRSDSSEYLYLVLQGADLGRETDEVEELLLETEWSALDVEIARESSLRIKRAFTK
ncbi:TBCD protein [Mycena belliarum]|uniref:TBCD protein n=1 Tax=Mycena belliarum TaxID=1033014 RepID=A0AAD6XXX4_9AGAR|nr:TBCD protein [Mycena belliae]